MITLYRQHGGNLYTTDDKLMICAEGADAHGLPKDWSGELEWSTHTFTGATEVVFTKIDEAWYVTFNSQLFHGTTHYLRKALSLNSSTIRYLRFTP